MIKAIITDFDGTLVDTFRANFLAYQKAFAEKGISLTEDKYRQYFGYRYDRFMPAMGVTDADEIEAIRMAKKTYYPQFFSYLCPNKPLIELIAGFKALGGKTAIASTASKENLTNALNHLGIADSFDTVVSGLDVKEGKPSPEIYIKAMDVLGVAPQETLIFEDSEIGIQAAKASGAHYMIVPKAQFDLCR